MHTFDRFTPRAKKVLALAQEAAQADNVNIAPEHIVLGMLRERLGMGPRVLTLLGVNSGKLTKELGPDPDQHRVESSGTVPTTEVSHVLRLAFEEANLLGHQAVNTGHLLLGVLAEGTSRAAVALGGVWRHAGAGQRAGQASEPATGRPRTHQRATTRERSGPSQLARGGQCAP